MNYQLLVQAAAAPVVTSLVRYGYHNQPTILVAAFSQDMNAQSASNLANYVLTTAGRDGSFGTRDDVRIALRSAVYDTSDAHGHPHARGADDPALPPLPPDGQRHADAGPEQLRGHLPGWTGCRQPRHELRAESSDPRS